MIVDQKGPLSSWWESLEALLKIDSELRQQIFVTSVTNAGFLEIVVSTELTAIWQALRGFQAGKDLEGNWIADSLLDLTPHLPATPTLFPKKLFVRRCYIELVTLIERILGTFTLSGIRMSPMIYGTLGVGKSFLGFFILRL